MTGRAAELRWQHAIVIAHEQDAEGSDRYQCFVPVDAQDVWVWDLPDTGVCFRKAHLQPTCATDEEMKQARAALAET